MTLVLPCIHYQTSFFSFYGLPLASWTEVRVFIRALLVFCPVAPVPLCCLAGTTHCSPRGPRCFCAHPRIPTCALLRSTSSRSECFCVPPCSRWWPKQSSVYKFQANLPHLLLCDLDVMVEAGIEPRTSFWPGSGAHSTTESLLQPCCAASPLGLIDCRCSGQGLVDPPLSLPCL